MNARRNSQNGGRFFLLRLLAFIPTRKVGTQKRAKLLNRFLVCCAHFSRVRASCGSSTTDREGKTAENSENGWFIMHDGEMWWWWDRKARGFFGHSTLHNVSETGCFNPFFTAGEMKPIGMGLKWKIAENLIKSFILKVFEERCRHTTCFPLRFANFSIHVANAIAPTTTLCNSRNWFNVNSPKRKKNFFLPLLMDRQWELLVPSYHVLLVTINKLSSTVGSLFLYDPTAGTTKSAWCGAGKVIWWADWVMSFVFVALKTFFFHHAQLVALISGCEERFSQHVASFAVWNVRKVASSQAEIASSKVLHSRRFF